MNKCENCLHADVCKYREQYESFINDDIREYMKYLDVIEELPFVKMNINCDKFIDRTVTLYKTIGPSIDRTLNEDNLRVQSHLGGLER